MDAVTPQTADAHSHLVRPDSMEWQKTRFPGCEGQDAAVRSQDRADDRADAVRAGRGAARP